MSTAHARARESAIAQTDSELTWVLAAKAGYSLAFEELVHRNEGRIFGLALQITQNEQDAEDVMQEAFARAYRNLSQFRGESRFSTWLASIAVNEALQKLRRRQRDPLALDQPLEGIDELVPHEMENWGDSPEKHYAQNELRQILSGAISALHPAYRVVFLLRDVEHLSNQETAQLLGLSVAAVKSRALRARLRLREHLSQYFKAA